MRPLVPLLHPLLDRRRRAVTVAALGTPAAAPMPASEEGKPEEREEGEQDEQEPEEAEYAEAEVGAVTVVVGCGSRPFRHVRRESVRPSDGVGHHAPARAPDGPP